MVAQERLENHVSQYCDCYQKRTFSQISPFFKILMLEYLIARRVLIWHFLTFDFLGLILLMFLIQNDEWAQEDSEFDSDMDEHDRNAPIELPKPKLYRILKQTKDTFGFRFDYDEERRGHLSRAIDEGSNCEFRKDFQKKKTLEKVEIESRHQCMLKAFYNKKLFITQRCLRKNFGNIAWYNFLLGLITYSQQKSVQ